MSGVNRHGIQQLHGPSFRGTYTVERGRWQARLAIASWSVPSPERVVCGVSGGQRPSTARKCAARPVIKPVSHTHLLGRPSGRTEGAIRLRPTASGRATQDDAIYAIRVVRKGRQQVRLRAENNPPPSPSSLLFCRTHQHTGATTTHRHHLRRIYELKGIRFRGENPITALWGM